jgi:hypothetical protein
MTEALPKKKKVMTEAMAAGVLKKIVEPFGLCI